MFLFFSDCQYKCHINCLEGIKRVCAHLIISENPHYESRINPEVGLAAQGYRCFECQAQITFSELNLYINSPYIKITPKTVTKLRFNFNFSFSKRLFHFWESFLIR